MPRARRSDSVSGGERWGTRDRPGWVPSLPETRGCPTGPFHTPTQTSPECGGPHGQSQPRWRWEGKTLTGGEGTNEMSPGTRRGTPEKGHTGAQRTALLEGGSGPLRTRGAGSRGPGPRGGDGPPPGRCAQAPAPPRTRVGRAAGRAPAAQARTALPACLPASAIFIRRIYFKTSTKRLVQSRWEHWFGGAPEHPLSPGRYSGPDIAAGAR